MARNNLQKRLAAARDAVEALGPALMRMRGKPSIARHLSGDPYKTSVDRAAEAWVVEYLRAVYPDDVFLAEEAFEQKRAPWAASEAFWTVDALDGTASFMDGFDGFCIQAAYILNGAPLVAVIHEPVPQTTYWAIYGHGAFRQNSQGRVRRLTLKPYRRWPQTAVFIDSSYPHGAVGQLLQMRGGRFLECGSTGVKICRVAEGWAHVLAKPVRYKLWDVAPGHLILAEAGGQLGFWNGSEIRYDTTEIYLPNMLAAPTGLFEFAVKELGKLSMEHL